MQQNLTSADIDESTALFVVDSSRKLRRFKTKDYLDFINPFVGERAFLIYDEPFTLSAERRWLDNCASRIDSGKSVFVLLVSNEDKLVGVGEARLLDYKERGNAFFGFAVSKEFRGKGNGERLVRKTIEAAKRTLNPKNMWIELFEINAPAKSLYSKVGFVEVARLENYYDHFGTPCAKIIMSYKGQ